MTEGGNGASSPNPDSPSQRPPAVGDSESGTRTTAGPPGRGSGPPAAQVDPLIGRVVNGRFHITSLIARGGMGRVYRAEQAPLGRVCALKVLTPVYQGENDPEFHKRFFLEASIASKITHPNSVTIFDYGQTEDDIYYMAMEYLEGVTLHRAIRMAGFFPEGRVAHIGRQVCRALREAHALGCIHRDLKPANIFLTEHGDEPDFVKVLDFGLVKNVLGQGGPEDQLTQTGLFMGSPKYMAPEQIRGERVDIRTDVYSLGIIMYEMLTGRVPFERQTSLNTLMAQVNDRPPSLLETNPNAKVSPEMEDLVFRCMAKNPEERAASMDEVLASLKRLVGSGGIGLTGEYRALGAAASGAYAKAEATPGPSRPPMSLGSLRAATLSDGTGSTDGPSVSVSMTGVGSDSQRISHVPSMTPMSAGSPTPSLPPPDFRRGSNVVPAVLGALGASVVGLIAVFALRTSQPAPETATAVAALPVAPAPPGPSGVAPAIPSTPAAPSAAPMVTTLSVHFVSEPAGASVKEGATEICAATPCDHSFPADMSMEHKVVISHPGYKPETRVVHGTDAQVAVTLAAQKAWAPPPKGPSGGKPTDPNATPQGFKDIPY